MKVDISRENNPLTGIIPEYPEGYGSRTIDKECSFMFTLPAPVDHHKRTKKLIGVPLGKKGSLMRGYNPPVVPAVGSIYRKDKSICDLNYNDISNDISVVLKGISYHIEIREYSVYLNDRLVVTAPMFMKPPRAKKFCKAVVSTMTMDDQNLIDQYNRIFNIQEKPIVPITQYPFMIGPVPAGYLPYLRCTITEVPV